MEEKPWPPYKECDACHTVNPSDAAIWSEMRAGFERMPVWPTILIIILSIPVALAIISQFGGHEKHKRAKTDFRNLMSFV